jgi:hypothetical protein
VDLNGRPHVVSDQGRHGRKAFYSYFSGSAWLTRELRPPRELVLSINEPKIVVAGRTIYVTCWWRGATPEGAGPWRVGLQEIDSSGDPALSAWVEIGPGASPVLNVDRQGRVILSWRASANNLNTRSLRASNRLGRRRISC